MRLTFGQQIALRRKALGWQQPVLARAAGVSPSGVRRVEKGDPTASEAMKAAVLRAIEEAERARGIGPDLSAPSATLEPSKEGADAAAKLQQVDARLHRIELFLAETLEDVRRARAVIAPADSSDQRKRG